MGNVFKELSEGKEAARAAAEEAAEQRVNQLSEAESRVLRLEAELIQVEANATRRCEAAEARAAAAVQQSYELRKQLSRPGPKTDWSKSAASPMTSRVSARRTVIALHSCDL